MWNESCRRHNAATSSYFVSRTTERSGLDVVNKHLRAVGTRNTINNSSRTAQYPHVNTNVRGSPPAFEQKVLLSKVEGAWTQRMSPTFQSHPVMHRGEALDLSGVYYCRNPQGCVVWSSRGRTQAGQHQWGQDPSHARVSQEVDALLHSPAIHCTPTACLAHRNSS